MKNQNIPFTATFLVFSLPALSPMAKAGSPAPDGGYPGLNTAEGQNALLGLTTGAANTAVDWLSLESNIDGSFNTAVGARTLVNNLGSFNIADGTLALFSNMDGSENEAIGVNAFFNNTGGFDNVANGYDALFNNTTGSDNAANCNQAPRRQYDWEFQHRHRPTNTPKQHDRR